MPKRLSRSADINQIAHQLVTRSTQQPEEKTPPAPKPKPKKGPQQSIISRIMSEMGRKGGKVSGKRRMQNLEPEKRREIALKAAKARWAKAKRQSPKT